MAIELWWGSGSPYAWRVMLALAVKGLPWESHLLEFSKQETRTPEFLALNPRGKVPVLRDGDTVVRESQAILLYLDRLAPEPPLWGRTPAEAALVARMLIEQDAFLEPAARGIYRPIFFGTLETEGEAVLAAAGHLACELTPIEARLGEADWLVGDGISAADLNLYPLLAALERALARPAGAALHLPVLPWETHWPALGRWMARIRALPGYADTVPPHWRGTA